MLPWRGRSLVHSAAGKAFRASHRRVAPGWWVVRVGRRRLRLPLTADRIWLDWDLALAVGGHDLAVKRTYAALVASPTPPEVMLDIGASYGSHSLVFLAHGIPTISFEPNPACHGYFREACSLNGVVPALESVALGAAAGSADLVFPEDETWMGSIDPGVQGRLGSGGEMVSRRVSVATLDDYLPRFTGRRLLVKIDTEGFEAEVLRGAAITLRTLRPPVIFESNDPAGRAELLQVLAASGYRVARLPWLAPRPPRLFAGDEFLASRETNFLALPAEERE